MNEFIPVIGLEIHVQLSTKSKMFCSCSTDYIGARPNNHVCPICLGLPGSLPVINERAIMYAVRMALAMRCKVNTHTVFHRKHYFYPDLPKAYQISQYDLPLAVDGHLEVNDDGKAHKIRIQRLHLEEDAGKLVHAAVGGRLMGADYSLVDYNRSGVPLMEIVTQPDITSPKQAREFVSRLRQLVRYLGVSDGDMESGSLRVDANISIMESGGKWGEKVEVKNMNSLKALERALEYEYERQKEVKSKGETIVRETRHWDDDSGKTISSRSKEEAEDYRYFPDPDLPPLVVDERTIVQLCKELPELPWEVRDRFISDYGLSLEEAEVLTERRDVALLMDDLVKRGSPVKVASNWIRTEIMRVLNERAISAEELTIPPDEMALLLSRIDRGDLSTTAAKEVFAMMLEKSLNVDDAIRALGLSTGKLTGSDLEAIVVKVLAENAEVVEEIRAGKDKKGKKVKFLQGIVMRETKGQADPKEVQSLIMSKI
ncbi:aspartyl/glutamyl-tRNA(Asn/Gln) amidotransferase subunit B [Acetomicrobium thermoterrenum DSM 13490]|uniref:Aspartyl/glutamyl-tRNA(Asn/Gln) amidotransferase subunit B n=1 Tax=Acetomicrobium thermoterrenum DSM 13490 TaxID=1120987 RepID=A0A1H3E8R5_9BACT|nr:Asp-tRNA(Asn)/Glu-tRNA(Gln) amidotransferase subunit GatB [Acetomicrobium thermoterrenum]SDX75152.1 aspartyl/glutamyl-tRNA(Asn/Gln) amidotransferase subunit B [Acetomicrobium thermoterrenum DSM 13490]